MEPIGKANLLLVASGLLIAAVICANRLNSAALASAGRESGFRGRQRGPGQAAGRRRHVRRLQLLFKSPYLGGIALWVFLLSLMGTFLYFTQADIVAAITSDLQDRTKIFATIALWVGIL